MFILNWAWKLAERVAVGMDFTMRVIAAMPATLVREFATIVVQFERVAWGGFPLAAVAGLCVGLVTWLQTHRLLAAYSLEISTPGILMVAVVVETGPILASLLVAGRMGAGLAAEFGSMTLTEELDARQVLGARIIPTLVAPRVWACMLATPVLTIVFDAFALLGGLTGELTGGSLSFEGFLGRSLDYLELGDSLSATAKTAVFGFLIGVIGSWTGLRAGGSTEQVGRASTRGVVSSSLAVFIANAAIAPWLQALVAALDGGG